jgi:hypothetical protein
MRKLLVLLVGLPLVALGCTSANDAFLLKALDDQAKAQALTNEGIQEYQIHLVQRHEYDQIPQIRQYFTTALSYDPGNTQAQQYVSIVDNFKSQRLSANVRAATRMMAKAKRSDEENYALFVTLQAAATIDPTDKRVQKMLSDTAQDRSQLVASYVSKSKAAVAGLTDSSSDAQREKAYLESLQWANRAMDVDPNNGAARGQAGAATGELTKLVTARTAAIQKLIANLKFTDARSQIASLNRLNRRTGNTFDDQVGTVSYSLNYSWAKWLYGQKDYDTAETRVDAALTVERTDEAVALKRRIVAMRTKADTGQSFDAGLKDIDRLIAAGELVSANRRIVSMARVTTNSDEQSTLDDRRQTILGKLKDIYDQGVQAYRDEDFKTAIELLQTVVAIQVDYEQASDYLDRARSKEKVLEQLK